MPSAAAYDSTTVAISTSGAVTARSSTARISSTTPSTSGMIARLSFPAARPASSTTAVLPPTLASAPGTACTAARTRSTVSLAAWLSGGSVRVARNSACPSWRTGGVVADTPAVAPVAARTAGAPAPVETIVSGAPVPPGKCCSSSCWPTTESGLPVKVPAVESPLASSETSPTQQAASASAVPTHTLRGRRPIQAPTWAQRPVLVGSAVP